MKTNLKFDHSKDDLFEATGFTEEQTTTFNKKRVSITQKIMTDQITQSQVTEIIMNDFTPEELVIATAFYIIDTTNQIIESPIGGMIMSMSRIIKKFKEITEEDPEEKKE